MTRASVKRLREKAQMARKSTKKKFAAFLRQIFLFVRVKVA